MKTITITVTLTEEQAKQLDDLTRWFNQWGAAAPQAGPLAPPVPFLPDEFLVVCIPGWIIKAHKLEAPNAGRHESLPVVTEERKV